MATRAASLASTDAPGGPTALRILLGTQLRQLREGQGITASQAAAAIRGSESKISRIELGRNAVREIDVADLLTLYGVTSRDERAALLSLASQANAPGWWYRYNDIVPAWFQAYIGLEEAAESIHIYEPQFIPGLLQTAQYAAAVLGMGDIPPDEIQRHVMLRRERQRRFGAGELRLWVILDEEVLHRRVADERVMCGQLKHLLRASQHPGLFLQITPREVSGQTAPSGFSILSFADPKMTDIVYVEQLTSALYLDKRLEVDRYALAMERTSMVSTDAAASAAMISGILAAAGASA